MSKSVVEFTARRVTYDTSIPIAEVIARLDKEVNKTGGGPEVFRLLSTVQTRTELERGMHALTDGRDFVFFLGAAYHRWLNAYNGTTDTPQTYGYMFGNPLVAQAMLRHDLTAALHVPPKIVIVRTGAGRGSRTTTPRPSSPSRLRADRMCIRNWLRRLKR